MTRQVMTRQVLIRQVLIRAAAVVGLVVVTTFAVATSASAHNVLLQTNPADKSTVATLPNAVTLTFNEPAQAIGSVMRVVGPAGDVAQGPPTLVDRQVTEAVRPGSPGGAYTVQWRVTSLDGHPISGQFTFTATAGDGGTAPSAAAGGTPEATSGALPAVSGSSGGSGGSSTAIIGLLIVVGVLVVAAGVFLAVRRPGPTLAADEIADKPARAD
jgi:methionine-rich copper-binding protein CopC